MDYSTLKLMNPAASSIFEDVTVHGISSNLLEVALRYISTIQYKKTQGKVLPLRVDKVYAAKNDEHVHYITHESYQDVDIFVATSDSGEVEDLVLEGWVEKNEKPYQLSLFLSSSGIPTKVFFNEETQKVYIVAARVTSRWVEVLSASLFKLLPRHISPEDLSQDDVNFFRAIYNRLPDEMVKYANKICDGVDFTKVYMRKELKGWANNYRESVIKNLRDSVLSTSKEISNYLEALSKKENTLQDAKYKLSVFENSPEQDPDSLINFFECHDNLRLWKVLKRGSDGKEMYYAVIDTIEYYSLDEFTSAYENEHSYFYNSHSSENMRKVFYGVFKENKGVFKTEAVFKMVNLASITPVSELTGFFDDALPHPHLSSYNCLGGNREPIRQYLLSGEWDLAIEQTIVAAKNINFGDTTVLSTLIKDMSNYWDTKKFIIADNGEQMTCEEFLNYINS